MSDERDPHGHPAPESEHGHDEHDGFFGSASHEVRPRRRGGVKSCVALLVVAAVVVAAGVAAVAVGRDRIQDLMSGPADFSGEGTGSLVFEVQEGDSTAQIGRNLKAEGVVKSVEAFTEAAQENDKATAIQVGFYELRKEMPAADALEILVDPANQVKSTVTIPEGLRVPDTIEVLADKTDFSAKQFRRALKNPAIGLPDYARGNPEGYLFPATYDFPPAAKPVDMLATMVDRWRQAAEEADLEGKARELGYTPAELMIIASLVESEANRDEDRGKVARVIYNRLETDATNGKLQIDATVNYALGRDLGLGLTTEDLEVDSPYNTRRYPGLPPGPIESPGDKAIEAATDPTPGDWVYYVTVNLDTGETKFTSDYDQFLEWKNNDLAEYCESSERC